MANTGTAVRPFGMRDKLGYMFGDFGNDFTFMLSSSFMMVFYTDIMGVPAGIVGLLMMVARFADAFTDVAMGQIVDRAWARSWTAPNPPRTAVSAPGSSGCAGRWPSPPS